MDPLDTIRLIVVVVNPLVEEVLARTVTEQRHKNHGGDYWIPLDFVMALYLPRDYVLLLHQDDPWAEMH
jgi:hypothetical protein